MTRWKYMKAKMRGRMDVEIGSSYQEQEDYINTGTTWIHYGREGWELVSTEMNEKKDIWGFFKKPI